MTLVRDAGRLVLGVRLSAVDGVDVDGRPSRLGGNDGHVRDPCLELGLQLRTHELQEGRHVHDGAAADVGHAPVGRPAVRRDVEPVDALVAYADASGTEGFRDDHVVGPIARDPSDSAQVGHTGEASALLVDGATHLDGASQRRSGPADRLHGEGRRRDAALHVRCPPAEQSAFPHLAAEGVDRPAGSRRYDVEVAVEVHERPRPRALEQPDHVHPGMVGGVLRPPGCIHVVHGHSPGFEPASDGLGALRVRLARRVHGGDADELGREVDDLVAGALDLLEHAIDGVGHGDLSSADGCAGG